MARPPGRRLKCRARSKRTGLPCSNWAVEGWQVCRMHGARGGAPPEKMRGNQNSLKHGGLATVTVAKWIRRRVKFEPPVSPDAMLRNLARTTTARIEFVLRIGLMYEAELERLGVAGALGPEALRLSEVVNKKNWRYDGRSSEWIRSRYLTLWKRWLSVNAVLDRLEARLLRIATQLTPNLPGSLPEGAVVLVVESRAPAAAQGARALPA